MPRAFSSTDKKLVMDNNSQQWLMSLTVRGEQVSTETESQSMDWEGEGDLFIA